MWSHDELSTADLVGIAAELPRTPGACGCLTEAQSGTRNGFMCSAHRAIKILKRREPRLGVHTRERASSDGGGVERVDRDTPSFSY